MRSVPYHPKKSLGQHFLHDGNIARNIVEALAPAEDDHVVEIGSGPGVLTALLAERRIRLTAVEVDARAVDTLRQRFRSAGAADMHILHRDVLELDLHALAGGDARALHLIGNLPYNITSQILFHVFAQQQVVADAVFMMQREVAARILAPPGGKEYGILSVICGAHAALRRCFHVSPNVFVPKPKVWSTVLHFDLRQNRLGEIENYSFFRMLVKATFGQRRKTIANSMRQLGHDRGDYPADAAPYLSLRP
ncbi:MAG: 16S rRNA (adenine(1518)-N(6)/adenine(1519)-N(6))-dimethyltransferase RsmA, partial [Bacteroidota bacterium]|nr:16S rRNA (adenine(1518)-N(6)/adenine(1519)-N(6))-dimethyltransferase RsmA [Bacteroidota bacterium]